MVLVFENKKKVKGNLVYESVHLYKISSCMVQICGDSNFEFCFCQEISPKLLIFLRLV